MTEAPASPTVLVIEHDPGVRTLLGRMLSRWGYYPLLASSEEEGLRTAAGRDVALVVSDFLPGPGEATVHEKLGQSGDGSGPPSFLCTLGSPRGAPDGVETLPRPFDALRLRSEVRRLIDGG